MKTSVIRTAEIHDAIKQIITDLENENTHIDWKDGGEVYTRLKGWFGSSNLEEFLHLATRKAMDGYDKAHRPGGGKSGDQASLFQEDILLPMGDGGRVRMARAKLKDLETWRAVLVQEFQASERAHKVSIRYLNTRIEAFDQSADEELLSVEERVFGYRRNAETSAAHSIA
jgi:hypothetical protein